jgi:hypothetical protein
MNIGDFFTLAPKLMPIMPRIAKAIATIEKLMNDPEIKDALSVAEEVATILNTLSPKGNPHA